MGYIIVRALHGIGTPHVSCVIHRRRRRRRAIQEPCQRFYCSTARLLHTRTHTQHPSRSIQRRRPADLSRLGIYDTYARARFLIDPPRAGQLYYYFPPRQQYAFFFPSFFPSFPSSSSLSSFSFTVPARFHAPVLPLIPARRPTYTQLRPRGARKLFTPRSRALLL